MNRQNAIGIFDSGLGGLTVYQQLKRELPNEKIIYLGDTARVPYGSKSANTITKYCLQIIDFLVSQKIKLIVVACNTASSIAKEAIIKHTDIPVVDVISPSITEALNQTKRKAVGVLGTQATIESGSYQKQISLLNKDIKVYSQPCPLLVPIIEEGLFQHKIAEETVKMYLKGLDMEKIDTLILGCTHYPILKNMIIKQIDSHINIIDSSLVTTNYIKKYLIKSDMKSTFTSIAKDQIFTTDEIRKFDYLANQFLKKTIKNIKKIELA